MATHVGRMSWQLPGFGGIPYPEDPAEETGSRVSYIFVTHVSGPSQPVRQGPLGGDTLNPAADLLTAELFSYLR
jgi:hypothetical protein